MHLPLMDKNNCNRLPLLAEVDTALKTQTLRMTVRWARAALARRDFALALQLTSFTLRESVAETEAVTPQDQIQAWLCRSLAFAGAGCAHLCLKSLRQTAALLKGRPVFEDATSFLEESLLMSAAVRTPLEVLTRVSVGFFMSTSLEPSGGGDQVGGRGRAGSAGPAG